VHVRYDNLKSAVSRVFGRSRIESDRWVQFRSTASPSGPASSKPAPTPTDSPKPSPGKDRSDQPRTPGLSPQGPPPPPRKRSPPPLTAGGCERRSYSPATRAVRDARHCCSARSLGRRPRISSAPSPSHSAWKAVAAVGTSMVRSWPWCSSRLTRSCRVVQAMRAASRTRLRCSGSVGGCWTPSSTRTGWSETSFR